MAQCKLLVIGAPKAGKTALLAGASNSGRIIRYLDFDNNYAPLVSFTTPEGKKNIQRIACIDETSPEVEFTNNGEVKISNKITAFKSWPTMISALKKWPKDDSNPNDWGNESILVIDSLSSMSRAAEHGFLKMNNRSGSALRWQEFRHIQEQVFEFLVHIGNTLKCPIIVMAHIQLNGPDLSPIEEIGVDESARELQRKVIEKKLEAAEIIDWSLGPISTGKAKSMILPSVFSGTVFMESDQSGHWLYTKSRKGLQIGVPVPNLPSRLPGNTALATILDSWAPMKKEKSSENIKEKE
jgi:hypothetical protein